ncbi:hypothetical protein M2139_002457 [Enterococcus sp. PF1-24]|uniref:glycerol dehydratase reactivase beta/small subunit family protein n=1 Tax=unclassified Enterococcus TaxID=2608891 RepID=UPI0024743E48|nr:MULTISPECIES: glycerol dehydratase reactivase beta/small subunit family protein [unclassified Enterococcus]MDH6365454.1 hypothetical protein [Enterococcus sp. PFB1-1]MDH6402555.1 hypothetical protein [Enterococcus sp. PF1-24]
MVVSDFSIRPQIFIYVTDEKLTATIEYLLYGIEEEGIPYQIVAVSAQEAVAAAYEAAKTSSLSTGVGCDGQKVVLHYKNLAPNQPYLVIDRYQTVSKKQLKAFGSNCARLVKRIPFKDLEENE